MDEKLLEPIGILAHSNQNVAIKTFLLPFTNIHFEETSSFCGEVLKSERGLRRWNTNSVLKSRREKYYIPANF